MYVFEEKFQKLKIRLSSKGSSITVNKSIHLPNYINNSWVGFGTSDPDLDQNKHPICQKKIFKNILADSFSLLFETGRRATYLSLADMAGKL
jgi:hypothetical protein